MLERVDTKGTKDCENKTRIGSYEVDCWHKDRFLGPLVKSSTWASFVTLLFPSCSFVMKEFRVLRTK